MDPNQIACDLSAAGFGVFSRDQARSAGLSRHQIDGLIARGIVVPLQRGVYYLAGRAPTVRMRSRAVALAAGDGAVVDRWTAAILHGLLPDDRSRPISVAIPNTRQSQLRDADVMRRTDSLVGQCVRLDAMSVTSPTRTILDCAAFLSKRALEDMLDHALERRTTALPDMARALKQASAQHRAGSARMAAVLAEHAGETRPSNRFERQISRLIVNGGLPVPMRQHTVVTTSGDRHIDLAYPQARIGIEPAGFKWHASRTAWASDLTRNDSLAAIGWLIFGVTWEERRDGTRLLPNLRLALAERWPKCLR